MHQLPRQPRQPALRLDHQRPKLLPTRQHPDHWYFQEGSGYLELVSPSLSPVCLFGEEAGRPELVADHVFLFPARTLPVELA